MGRDIKVGVVLPTMNEAGNVRSVCESLLSFKKTISESLGEGIKFDKAVFVLNGTRDGTDKVLQEIKEQPEYEFLEIISSRPARGRAMRTGVEFFKDDVQNRILVVMDSDGEYDAKKHIPVVVRPLIEGGYVAAVAGARDGRSSYRSVLSNIASILYGGLDCEGAQSGIKALLGKVALETIPKNVPGLDIDVRWMYRVVRKYKKERISNEALVELEERKYGKTSFNPIVLGMGLLYTTASLYLHRKTGKELPCPRIVKRMLYSSE